MFTLFVPEPRYSIMGGMPLQSRPVSQHCTVPVSREEALAVREKFRRASWRAPNHKPKTTKSWHGLGTVPGSWRPSSGVRVRATDDVLSDIVSTSV
jgi:hypothetical protein